MVVNGYIRDIFIDIHVTCQHFDVKTFVCYVCPVKLVSSGRCSLENGTKSETHVVFSAFLSLNLRLALIQYNHRPSSDCIINFCTQLLPVRDLPAKRLRVTGHKTGAS